MSAKEPKSIKSVLLGLSPELSALVEQAESHVTLRDQVAGLLAEPMRRHVVAARLEDNALTVLCDSAPWATRIRFYAQTLLQNLAADHNLEANAVIVKVRPHFRPDT
ncbi:MAG: DciA family protein [Gammaproteobacteria bacterium]